LALRENFAALGIEAGDTVMVHAAVSKVGPLLGGPDTLIAALCDAVGPAGTLMAYTDWEIGDSGVMEADGLIPPEWRQHVRPFDPLASRATRDNGILPEFVRTTPGALRSGNPGASVTALGARAAWLTADHPLDYGYGDGSPLARLVELGGKVVNIGAPRDTMTLLHHAEHLARLPGKRVLRYEVPFAASDGVVWRWIEEFDTSDPVVEGLKDDYFADIVTTFLATGRGREGRVGLAKSLVVPAAEIVAFAVDGLEARYGG
jgi:aminoglycoside 3-N-acetyltransferase